ncbi:MAG: cation acetate symporter, partial [Arthrobacter sp.]
IVAGGMFSVSGNAVPVWLEQPAAWTVPAAFAVTVLVSLRGPGTIPAGTGRFLARLHTPERALRP